MSNGQRIVRRLNSGDDLRAVAGVYAASWRAAYRGLVPQAYLDALSPDDWTGSLAARARRTWIACEGGEVVGVSTYGPARDEAFFSWGEVVSIYVRPEHLHAGWGSRLLQASLDALSAEGFASVCLWVLEGNAAARAFYERCGFVCNGDVLDVEVGGAPLREVRYVRALERTNATRPHS
ncbi:N-acetyltransferase family protein [Rubneribacter sp.]